MSNVGEVLDISAGGMCVLAKRLPDRAFTEIYLEGQALPGILKAMVAWTKRKGLFKHEIGYRFEDVSPEMGRALASIAANNRFRRSI